MSVNTAATRGVLNDRTIIVTGCASGIGEATASVLASRGAQVIGLDRRPPASDLNFIEIDLASSASVTAAMGKLPSTVDGLANVAGVSSGLGDPLAVMSVNFLGLRELTEAVVDRMPAGSAVASTSSLAAAQYRSHRAAIDALVRTADREEALRWLRRHPDELGTGYVLSKEAVIVYTQRQSWAWAPRGIRVNCTAPGVTDTPMLEVAAGSVGSDILNAIRKPMGRLATALEQAHVLAFLIGPESTYVSGQVIWVDGGYSAAVEAGLCEPASTGLSAPDTNASRTNCSASPASHGWGPAAAT